MQVTSEVAGTIWKLQKQVGDAVDTGESILLIESMKMEIPVVSPQAGTIKEILVSEGEMVEEGQPLVQLG